MEFIIYLVIFIVGSLIVAAINSSSDPLTPARELAEKFKEIGNMTGMHKNSIIEVVGQPQSWSQIGEDTLIQWILPGYHISIMFDQNGYFIGINSETYTA